MVNFMFQLDQVKEFSDTSYSIFICALIIICSRDRGYQVVLILCKPQGIELGITMIYFVQVPGLEKLYQYPQQEDGYTRQGERANLAFSGVLALSRPYADWSIKTQVHTHCRSLSCTWEKYNWDTNAIVLSWKCLIDINIKIIYHY